MAKFSASGLFYCLMAAHNEKNSMERPGRIIMDGGDIARALKRIAHEIAERNRGVENVALVGIPKHGVPLARRIAGHLAQIEGHEVPVGALDVALYRDDYGRRTAAPQQTKIEFSVH